MNGKKITKGKLALIVVWPIAGLAVFFALRAEAAAAKGADLEVLTRTGWWMLALIGLYAANWFAAWRYRDNWTATLVRLLGWGIAAYLCVSNLLDIFAADRELLSKILGEHEGIAGQRARAFAWLVGLIMAIVCIALGFERKVGEDEETTLADEGDQEP